MKNQHQHKNTQESGIIMSGILVFAFFSVLIVVGFVTWLSALIQVNRNLVSNEQAFHIAESGIEYYRWHLAHEKDDFYDGTGEPGEYVHTVEDKKGNEIGSFTLNIEAPESGSTVVVVESTGISNSNPDYSRAIRAEFALPSFAKYAFVADSNIRFGEGTVVYGPIHSNGGIRFDGIAYNVVSSAKEYYDDPDHSGDMEFGVHTHISPTDPLPPAEVPERSDVFVAGREFPKSTLDFSGITTDLAQYKQVAQDKGFYMSGSGAFGYLVDLKTNNTFDLYRVDSIKDVPHWSCQNDANQSGWGTWSYDELTLINNYEIPDNGMIFLEDDIWIEGHIDSSKATVVAAQFPDVTSNRKSITINSDLIYSNYDGSDSIGLIAQKDINIGLYSDDDFQIDAALIAQHGRVGRFYYPSTKNVWFWTYPGCNPYANRSTVTLNGMIASKNRYGFAYTNGTGYENRNINYDANLLYNAPPFFPLTSDNYEMIKWEEVE
jgi:hypothetical protein